MKEQIIFLMDRLMISEFYEKYNNQQLILACLFLIGKFEGDEKLNWNMCQYLAHRISDSELEIIWEAERDIIPFFSDLIHSDFSFN